MSPNIKVISKTKTAHDRLLANYNPNKEEWNIWNKYKKTEYKEVLCPCIYLSDCCNYLIMIKAFNFNGVFPKKPIPPEIYDTKNKKNWGTLKKKPVLIDYGNNTLNFTVNGNSKA